MTASSIPVRPMVSSMSGASAFSGCSSSTVLTVARLKASTFFFPTLSPLPLIPSGPTFSLNSVHTIMDTFCTVVTHAGSCMLWPSSNNLLLTSLLRSPLMAECKKALTLFASGPGFARYQSFSFSAAYTAGSSSRPCFRTSNSAAA